MRYVQAKTKHFFPLAFLLAVCCHVSAGEFGQPDGMPIKLGSKISEVKSLLNTTLEPEPQDGSIVSGWSYRRYLDIRTKGIYLTFSQGLLVGAKFEKPFSSSINGISIGDTTSKLKSIIGENLIEKSIYRNIKCPSGDQKKYVHHYDDVTTITYITEDDIVTLISVDK